MDAYDYKMNVVSEKNSFNKQRGCVVSAEGTPERWNMQQITGPGAGFYRVGYLLPINEPDCLCDYWWCRHYHWRPFWGNLTRNHAVLMRDLRKYWWKRWLCEQDEKREIILSVSRLPEILVDGIVESIPYMYQTKRV